MSLMEFLEIREGRLAPVYKDLLVPIRCGRMGMHVN